MSGVRTTGRRKESNTMRIRDEIRQRKQTRREEGRRWEHWRLCTPGYTPEQCICSMPQKRFNWAVSIYSGYDPPVRFGKANVHQESGIHVHDKLGSGNTTSNRSTHSQNHHCTRRHTTAVCLWVHSCIRLKLRHYLAPRRRLLKNKLCTGTPIPPILLSLD
jgi:hypothetical protein